MARQARALHHHHQLPWESLREHTGRLPGCPTPIGSFVMVMEGLGATGFFLSLAGLMVAYGGRSPLLDKVLWSCLTLTGSLGCAGLIGLADGRTLGLSCLGFLISVQAIATARHAERESVDAEPAERVDEEPAWWPDFERDFRRYTHRASQRGGTS